MIVMIVTVMMAATVPGQPDEPAPPGASAVFTSPGPIMAQVRELMADGRLREAEQLLGRDEPEPDPDTGRMKTEAKEIIRRLRREYDLELDELVTRLSKAIPDVTAADVQRWREGGQVQWRMIDGRVCYFRREPANVFRFCDESKRRRDQHAAQAKSVSSKPTARPRSERELLDHLARVVRAAETGSRRQVLPMRHHVRYSLTVHPNRPGANAGARVRCWLPFPQEYRQQRDVKLIHTSPARPVIAPNVIDGKAPGGAPQRTVYLEQRISDPSRPVVFEEEFEYVSRAYYPNITDADALPLPGDYDGAYLAERPPHIVFTPELQRTVREVVGDETHPLAKARRIFHFVTDTIRYCAEEEYSVIPSLTIKALTSGKGDCGAQSMLFITMCRAAGIPARWQSGYQTRPGAWDMHDWAEFYVEPWGWLPADVSYGLKESDDRRIRAFYFGHLDSYRLIVNLEYGSALHPPKDSLRSEPADFQRGEVEIDGRNLYFDEWDWDLEFEVKPLAD